MIFMACLLPPVCLAQRATDRAGITPAPCPSCARPSHLERAQKLDLLGIALAGGAPLGSGDRETAGRVRGQARRSGSFVPCGEGEQRRAPAAFLRPTDARRSRLHAGAPAHGQNTTRDNRAGRRMRVSQCDRATAGFAQDSTGAQPRRRRKRLGISAPWCCGKGAAARLWPNWRGPTACNPR